MYRPHNTLTPRRTKPYHCRKCEETKGYRVSFYDYDELVAHRVKCQAKNKK